MAYEKPLNRNSPEKRRFTGGNALTQRFEERQGNITIPCEVLLFSYNNHYKGAVSLQVPAKESLNKAKYIGWLKILSDYTGFRNWILPVERLTENRAKIGKPYLAVQETAESLRHDKGDFKRQLEILKNRTSETLCGMVLREVDVDKEFIIDMKRRFPEEYTDIIEQGKKKVYVAENPSKVELPSLY